jgi:hypothetical protein
MPDNYFSCNMDLVRLQRSHDLARVVPETYALAPTPRSGSGFETYMWVSETPPEFNRLRAWISGGDQEFLSIQKQYDFWDEGNFNIIIMIYRT